MLKKLSIFAGILLLVILGTGGYLYRAATRLPDNRPAALAGRNRTAVGKVVVCIGDSLTHGRVSANFVDDLDDRFTDDYLFVNAG